MTGDPHIDALDLEPDVATKALQLRRACHRVVFTSGRRTLAQQAHAMATNCAIRRSYIANTYAESPVRHALVAWLAANPHAVTVAAIAVGFEAVMERLPVAELVHLSRHLNGRAFDVLPNSCPVAAIEALKPQEFLTRESGLVRWHVQF